MCLLDPPRERLMRGVEQIPFVYDAMMAVFEFLGLGRWRQWLVSGATARTLDIGCGTGRNLPRYPGGCVVIGLDPSARFSARPNR